MKNLVSSCFAKKLSLCIIVLMLILGIPFNIARANPDIGDVVLDFPCPSVSEPEGLAFGQGYLWFASQTQGIYQLDPTDGSVITSIPQPSGCGEIHGLTHDGLYLWAACLDNYLYQLDSGDGSIITQIPALGSGHIEGLAWDGEYLWLSRGSGIIYKVNSTNGDIVKSLPTGSPIPEGLAYGAGFLWEGGDNGIIYKIDPQTDSIISSFSAPGSDVHGLAWDGAYLWSDSARANWIYKIDVGILPPPVVPSVTLLGGIVMAAVLGLLMVYSVGRRQTAFGS